MKGIWKWKEEKNIGKEDTQLNKWIPGEVWIKA
jgi:hypothetical protein